MRQKQYWVVFWMIYGISAVQAAGPSLRMLSPGQTFATGDRTIALTIGQEAYDQWTPFIGSHTLEFVWADWFGWGDTFSAAVATCYSPPPGDIYSSSMHAHTARLKYAYGASVRVSNRRPPGC